MLERVWRKGTLLPCWWECKVGSATVENIEVPQKTKNRITI